MRKGRVTQLRDKKRAFSLIEILVSLSILLIFFGFTYMSGSQALKSMTDTRSEMVVSGEVNDTVAWLHSAIMRSLWTGNDFTLTVDNYEPRNFIFLKWKASKKIEMWSSDRISFRSFSFDIKNHAYTAKFQKMSPALTIEVYYGDSKKDKTGWRISISGFGFVRAFRNY